MAMAEKGLSSSFEELYKSFGVLIAGFLIVFLQNGSFKAFGVLFEDVVKEYKTSNFLTGGIFSFELAACYLIAGISGAILSKTKNRTMGITGGTFFGLGLILQGILGQRLWHLFLCMGLTAIGVGLLYFAVVMAYVEHFGDLFYMAYSLRDVFFYLGVIIMPPAVEVLRGTYGLHGTFLILGAIMWNGIVAGLLLKPKNKSRLKTKDTDDYDSDNSSKHNVNSCFECENSLIGLSAITNHPLFGLSVIVHSFTNFNFVIWALYLVPYGISLGYHPELAALLSTSGGAGGLVGKVLVIVVFYHGKMTQIISNAVPGIIYGIALAGYILCDNYNFLLIFSFMSGFSLAFADASTCAMIPRYICERHLRPGTVIFYFSGGTFTQLGGIVAGGILDVTSSFPNVFAVMVIVDVVIILLAVAMEKAEDTTGNHVSPELKTPEEN